ncbi:MAG: hypothetical protein ACOYJS_05905, partial [Acutalibacteraceae bacterium]
MKYYDGIVQKVNQLEQKNGIVYAKPSGALFKYLKIIYIIFFIYTMLNNLTFIASVVIKYSGGLKEAFTALITVGVCTILMVIGFVLFFYKQYVISAVVSAPPSLVLISVFGTMLKDKFSIKAYLPKFYWRHFVPLLLIVVLMVWMAVIFV